MPYASLQVAPSLEGGVAPLGHGMHQSSSHNQDGRQQEMGASSNLLGRSEGNLSTSTVASAPAASTKTSTISSMFSKPTASAYNPAGMNDAAAREAAIARKEAELLAREKDLTSREAELRRMGAKFPRKNWPVCFPLIHHDIAGDIPREMQGQVRLAYWCYLVSLPTMQQLLLTSCQQHIESSHASWGTWSCTDPQATATVSISHAGSCCVPGV